MASSNPAFNSDAFAHMDWAGSRSNAMTVTGTVGKTFLLLGVLSATAIWSWTQAGQGTLPPIALPGAAIAGLVVALITIFRPTAAAYTSPVYAALEGVFLGALSFYIERQYYPGIAMQATSLTIGTLLCMLIVYGTGVIKVTDKLAAGITAATGAIALVYLISMVVNLFGGRFPYIHDAGPIGIGFSLFVVGLAAFNLLLDFDFIERGARSEAPKYMEWYGAFGLIVTLVWLYLEILRLLRKFSDRR